MRKYLEIAAIHFKLQLTWRFDAALSVIFTVSKILFAYILWGAVFGEQQAVAGFTFPVMLTYYIVSSFLSQIDVSADVGYEISESICMGAFSKFMVIPACIQGYFAAKTVGKLVFSFLLQACAAVLWVYVFQIKFEITANPFIIITVISLVVLGLMFMVQLNFLLGILAFLYMDVEFLLLIKSNLTAFMTGTLVPLVFLPEGILLVMRLFPFYYITYLPSMALIGRLHHELLTGFLVLSVWLAVITIAGRTVYKRVRMKYDGVGI